MKRRTHILLLLLIAMSFEGHCQAWFFYQEADNYFYGINGREQSYEKSFNLYEKAAKQGCVLAERRLAICYKNGYGVAASERAALHWNKKAARHGNADAQGALGFYYFKPGTYKKSDKWFLKAANNGNEHVIIEMQQSFGRYSWGYCKEKTQDAMGQEVNWYELFMEY